MEIRFVTAESQDFRRLAAELDAYYFTLVGEIQHRYAEPNRPENMNGLAVVYAQETMCIPPMEAMERKPLSSMLVTIKPISSM